MRCVALQVGLYFRCAASSSTHMSTFRPISIAHLPGANEKAHPQTESGPDCSSSSRASRRTCSIAIACFGPNYESKLASNESPRDETYRTKRFRILELVSQLVIELKKLFVARDICVMLRHFELKVEAENAVATLG